jgi:hypothetical protein
MAGPVTVIRRRVRRLRRAAEELAPVRATMGRPVAGHVPPPPRDFAAFGAESWIVPSARVCNAHRIAVGARVVVLEHSNLVALDDGDGSQPVMRIGDGVRLARFNTIVAGAEIVFGDDVASSDSAAILSTWRDEFPPAATSTGSPVPDDAPVVIGKGAYLGCNSIVWPGVTIGDGAYVGEGAVVVEDVPARTVVYGSPATVVRRYDPVRGSWSGS